jgi:hypothetical protein
MTATNHALSGAIIGLAVSQPAIALPLAFASHFILDSIPHFGIRFSKNAAKRQLFHKYLLVDAALISLIIGFILFSNAGWLALACLFLAGCPDFVQAYQYLFNPSFRKNPGPKTNWFTEFHKKIQRSETEKGIFIEAPLAIVLFFVTLQLL